jgi:Flp pilus assembly protein TadG
MTGLHMIRRFVNDSRGTAAIEFAFVVLPLMLLMFGSIEVSRLVWVQNAVHEAAISGARCMAIRAANCANADVYNAAETTLFIRQAASSWGLEIALTDIELKPASGCGKASGFSGVVIKHKFTSVLLALSGYNLRAEACQPNQF